jgi:hypothetical protein
MKRLYLQSQFDSICLAVIGLTGLKLTRLRRVLPMVGILTILILWLMPDFSLSATPQTPMGEFYNGQLSPCANA